LHVVHAHGHGPNPLPLLLTHGWPGSFLEYLQLLPLLCDPGAHGADPADAFTVVVPSLPGYGFSGAPPATGLTGRQVARLWHAVMTTGLGYDRYVAHGSDLGAGVTGGLPETSRRPLPESTSPPLVWPLHRRRGLSRRTTSPPQWRPGRRRRAAMNTSMPPSPPLLAPRCPTAPPDWRLGSQRRSSPGAAPARMGALPLTASRSSRRSPCTGHWDDYDVAAAVLGPPPQLRGRNAA
jgi:pimeloyl-ACP methyl ester carboxylesterase